MTARAAAIAIAIAVLSQVSCLARLAQTRRITGTCEGACDHYLSCKDARSGDAATACIADCQQVFADRESLRAFESLSCADAVEYVDGHPASAAL